MKARKYLLNWASGEMRVFMNKESVFWRDLSHPPIKLERGEGVYLIDEDGNRYLDAASGAAVCSLGHGNGEIAQAFLRQTEQLNYAHMSKFYSQSLADLARELVSISPGNITKVHPVSGGSEANETAIKLARMYHVVRGEKRKYKIISRGSSYHGATLGALALSGKTLRQETYSPMMLPNPKISPAYCYRCPYGKNPDTCSLECADDLERAIVQEGEKTVSAFIAEPISGSSAPGVHPPDEYWVRIREICDKYSVLLILDEVMSGMGRSGKWWGIDYSGVKPDIISSAKGIGAGYTPLGAILIDDTIFQTLSESESSLNHGFTYGGNPISAAVGAKVIEIIKRQNLLDNVTNAGKTLLNGLRESIADHGNVGEIRGRGLLIGVEFVKNKKTKEPFAKEYNLPDRIRTACLNEGIYVYPGGSTVNGVRTSQIMIAPPFIVNEDHVSRIVEGLESAISQVLGV